MELHQGEGSKRKLRFKDRVQRKNSIQEDNITERVQEVVERRKGSQTVTPTEGFQYPRGPEGIKEATGLLAER
ncbi:hypothetical protein I79_012952 [Cricetulus griseus]|uniref:Uncharacterized protein n=1 Tax=Cricetulus griseus TaxID=10029 RepID=G3HQ58_CRIGR|nr:hypothetical protein I79_012952 [Cricetulus griseus]